VCRDVNRGEGVFSREGIRTANRDNKEGDVVERFIGYIVSVVVLAAMGAGLPRWFAWRRALVDRWPGGRKEAGHV